MQSGKQSGKGLLKITKRGKTEVFIFVLLQFVYFQNIYLQTMKRKTLYSFLSILLCIQSIVEPVKTGLSSLEKTGFERVNNQGESVVDIDVPKGHTAQPDFKFATESPKQEAPSHTSGPITIRLAM